MYIEMKKTGLDVSDLITLVQRKGGGNTGFPYKSFVCRCSNCLYSTKGKCALKECCCMDERIRAHTCTFGEMMRYCFSGIGDNVFQFRLRLAIEREAELKSCFLDAGHRKRLVDYIDTEGTFPSHAQTIRMRALSKEGKLDTDAINTIMNEEKPNQKARIKIPMEKIEKYFPVGTSEQKIEETIIKALAMYRQRQKENRDAR